MGSVKNKPLLIIDGYGFIFRAYHIQPPLSSPNGAPVGAVYGFTSMLIKLINDFKPEHAVIVLDHAGKNFRHDIYKDYKANRPSIAEDLVSQLNLVRTVADSLNFKHLSKSGFEADDIIATLATKASSTGREAIIISSDKDLMQLVDGFVKMYDPAKAKYITEEDIIAKFGVGAQKVREVQALIGDKSDNIPGVAGVGPKTAAQLINEYGSLEGIIKAIDLIKNPRWQNLLKDNLENAKLSWQLVGLDQNVEIEQDLDNFHWTPPSTQQISNFLNEYGFKSLHKRIENLFHLKIENSTLINPIIYEKKNTLKVIKIEESRQLEPLIIEAQKLGVVAIFYRIHDSKHNLILTAGGDLYNVNYQDQHDSHDLFSYSSVKLEDSEIKQRIHSLFSNKAIKKITYNLKSLLQLVDPYLVKTLASFDDLMLMDYVLNAGNKAHELLDVIEIYSGARPTENTYYAAYFIDCYNNLTSKLVVNKALHLYDSIDLPLCYILHGMEKIGVKIDIQYLHHLSLELAKKIQTIEKKIYSLAGKEFNISSPKQLGLILFDEMKLPFGKVSGKSKSYSTNVDILEKLNIEGYEVAQLLLDYRHLCKLKNTYTDTLPKQIDKTTSRIHTTFLQCATTTGRLSSINPNVQNIPIRTEEGNKIRAAFVASPGMKLISADYSQIELRILSHVANIKQLKQAFAENKDIHAQTASQIFDTPIETMEPEVRRKAKAINFGIIYGISAFGLARQLNISRKEAATYIERYFKEYPGIQQYMSKTIEHAKEHGFVANLLGRKCFLPNINSKDHTLRSFSERAAINAPMQSLASDIVKVAMIMLDKQLSANNMKTKMILQIHDELIFESPSVEVDSAMAIIKSTMQNAYLLDVAIDTKVSCGFNWQEL
jgi:DNA polymerase-1